MKIKSLISGMRVYLLTMALMVIAGYVHSQEKMQLTTNIWPVLFEVQKHDPFTRLEEVFMLLYTKLFMI